MKRQNHKVIVWLRVCVLAMFCPAFLWRCATVMNLEGGPIDTLPPVIVSMLPDNFTTNFTASKIYVTFDEFVQLKDQQKEFFTSPQMKKKPQLSIRGRGILIQIKDTLKENTTYALNFGSAVRDNNEGNPLYSMRYVFSTGPEVDSMVVSGYTADSYTADSVAKSFIYFFPADSVEDIPEYDSTMFKYQPAVIARAETNGIFIAQNLKPIPYRLSIRGRGILIQIKDTLKENTTYALNFGSAVRDNNEGNPLYSMRYVFSTGPEVDSMVVSGYTADSYTADSVAKSFIYFFPADSVEDIPEYDSTMFKYQPAVIARAETNGIFIAQNLKPIPYRVYAFEDKNNNQIYEPSVDQVGFLTGTYNPAELPDFGIWYDSIRRYVTADPQLYFRMFTDEAFGRQYLRESERPVQHKALLYFNAGHPRIDSIVFDSIPADRVIIEPQSRNRDTIALWFDVPSASLPDTIRGEITYMKHDSLDRLLPSTEKLKLAWRYIESKEEAKEREQLEKEKEKTLAAGEEWVEPEKPSTFTYKFSTTGSVTPETKLYVEFDYPLVRFDSAAVVLTEQMEKEEPRPIRIRWQQDTANMRRWWLDVPWQLKNNYALTIPKGALADVAEQQNDSIAVNYTGVDPEKFATFIVNVVGKSDEASYIVQLLNESGKLLQEKTGVHSGVCRFNYVPAGNVKFRIIEDMNDNGRWDTGNLVERRQPERAEYYMDDKNIDTFAAKENWEVELTIDMNKVFAPVTMQSLAELLEKREALRLQKVLEERAKNPRRNTNSNTSNTTSTMGGGFNSGMNTMMNGLR